MFPSDDPKLAINGGSPVRKAPWLENLTLGEAEKRAANEVMEGGYLSLFEGAHEPQAPFSFWGGPKVQELEKTWCDYYGSEYASSVNSATSGLSAAIGALGIGFGDEVIVSSYTMSACAACVLMYGAVPIFGDVELETGCVDPDSIEAHITPRTKAVIAVHQFGIPADMDRILELAVAHGLKVIEDCAQAHGAKYKGRNVGTMGDIGVFSLNVNKTIQTGEGGICITNDSDLCYRLALIRNHGEAVVDGAGYEDITNIVGFNYRLTELQAAIALEQLKRLKQFNDARAAYTDFLCQGLSRYSWFAPMGREGSESANTTFPFRYHPPVSGLPRKDLVAALRAEGMRFGEGYVAPLYLQPIYQRKLAFKHGYPFTAPENQDVETNYYKGVCPNTEKLHYEQLISCGMVRLPHTFEDIKQILEAINKVMCCVC